MSHGDGGGVRQLGDLRHGDRTHGVRVKRKPEPEGINSDIVRDHWVEKSGCYDRMTCLPVVKDDGSTADPHQCTGLNQVSSKKACCFFHSVQALEGGTNTEVMQEGCSEDKWKYDDRYYEGRENY